MAETYTPKYPALCPHCFDNMVDELCSLIGVHEAMKSENSAEVYAVLLSTRDAVLDSVAANLARLNDPEPHYGGR